MSKNLGELTAVVKLLSALAELDDPKDFPMTALAGLADIVPCDVITYNEIDLSTRAVSWFDFPPGTIDQRYRSVFGGLIQEHPLVVHMRTTEDGGARRISDSVSTRELHRLLLNHEFFKPSGVKHQLPMTLPAPLGALIGIAFSRSAHDFTDRERDVVKLLRRPLAGWYERLRRRADAAAVATALQERGGDGLTEREREVIELVAGGRTDVAIGHMLGCSARTVGKHLEHAYRKLGVVNRTAAVSRMRAS